MTRTLNRVAVASLALALSACGSSSTATMKMNMMSLSAATVATATRSAVEQLFSPLEVGPRAAGDYGAASVGSSGLSSFKLYISSIDVCENMTISGSGYSGTSGCSTIYENRTDDYDTFGVTEAAAASSGKYIDLLSATDRATLTKSVSVTAGSYNFGSINWYKPIKMTGEVARTNGSTLKTKACASNDTNGNCIVTAMETGSAAESIVKLNNGGSWFRFLKPFTVAADDSVEMDLAFDLDQKVFGGPNVSNGGVIQNSGCTTGGGSVCGIFAPMLKVIPVPRKTGETTMVETYDMSTTNSTEWKLRVQVYYNSADTAKTILAADIFPIPTATTNSNLVTAVYVYSVETTSAGVNTFKTYDGSDTLTAFTRGTTGSATLTCPTGATLPGCSSTAPMTWTSRTVRQLAN